VVVVLLQLDSIKSVYHLSILHDVTPITIIKWHRVWWYAPVHPVSMHARYTECRSIIATIIVNNYRVIRVDHLLSIQMDSGICMVLHRSKTVVRKRTIQVWSVINEYSCSQLRCLYTGECILFVDRNNNESSCKLLIVGVRNTTTCSDNFIDVNDSHNFIDVNKGHNFIIWVLSGCINIYDSLLVLIERLLNYLWIKL